MIVTREHFEASITRLRAEGLIPTEEAVRLLRRLVAPVITHPGFYDCPGSRNGKHHFFRGGLATHTYEVLELAIASARRHHELGDVIDFSALVVAVIWHDFGKVAEYKLVAPLPQPGQPFHTAEEVKRRSDPNADSGFWHDVSALHLVEKAPGLLHHITRAAFGIGAMCATRMGADPSSLLVEKILHIVEAHHGRREWGSPNVPGTLEAMIVHHADMQSVMRACGQNPAARP